MKPRRRRSPKAPKDPAVKRPTGRPPRPEKVKAELQAIFLDRYAQGETITRITSDLGVSCATPWRWEVSDPDGFGKLYALAKAEHAHAMAGLTIDISDGRETGWIQELEDLLARYVAYDAKARDEFLRAMVYTKINRDRLRVDTRKWYTAKVLPKIYGEKVTHELEFTREELERMTPEQLEAIANDKPVLRLA